MSPPYELLASVYDGGWFEYSEYVAGLVEQIEAERERPFRKVCDAACGTGLLLRLLGGGTDSTNERSRTLAGFDISPAMLEHACERVPEARLECADMRTDFPFSGPFDLITCVYDSLNYLLEAAEVESFFRSCRGRLFGDGVLLIDFNSSLMYRDRDGLEQPRIIGGMQFRETLAFDPGPPPLVTSTFTFPAGREIHYQRAYEAEEIEELLRRCGFRVFDTFDVLDAGSYDNAEDESGDASPSGKIVCTAVPD